MREAGSLEPKPGIPPTPTHLAELVERMKRQKPRESSGVLALQQSERRNPLAAGEHSGRALPFTVGGTPKAKICSACSTTHRAPARRE